MDMNFAGQMSPEEGVDESEGIAMSHHPAWMTKQVTFHTLKHKQSSRFAIFNMLSSGGLKRGPSKADLAEKANRSLQWAAYRFVNTTLFEVTCSMAIILNSIAIGVESHSSAAKQFG